jgi:hypothetical protein
MNTNIYKCIAVIAGLGISALFAAPTDNQTLNVSVSAVDSVAFENGSAALDINASQDGVLRGTTIVTYDSGSNEGSGGATRNISLSATEDVSTITGGTFKAVSAVPAGSGGSAAPEITVSTTPQVVVSGINTTYAADGTQLTYTFDAPANTPSTATATYTVTLTIAAA